MAAFGQLARQHDVAVEDGASRGRGAVQDVLGLAEGRVVVGTGHAVDEAALDRWITVARHQGWVAIDTETSAKDPMLAELVPGQGLSADDLEAGRPIAGEGSHDGVPRASAPLLIVADPPLPVRR